MLKCTSGHEFETWFGKGSDFEDQAKRGQIECPVCGDKTIKKAPMAPAVKRSDSLQFEKFAAKIREDIANNSEDMGDSFADEARAIHKGEAPKRNIYGEASAKDALKLVKDGIDIVPLPPAFTPRKTKKIN